MKKAIIIGLTLHLWIGAAHGKVDVPTIMKQADAAAKSGDTRKALKLYKKVISVEPGFKGAYGALSILMLKQQQYQPAAKLLGEATRRFPTYAEGWYNYAYTLRKTGRLKQALAAYRRFVALKPKHADPHYGIGLTLKEMKQYRAAAASFRRYAQLEHRSDKKDWVKRALSLATKLEGQARSNSAPAPADPAVAKSLSSASSHIGPKRLPKKTPVPTKRSSLPTKAPGDGVTPPAVKATPGAIPGGGKPIVDLGRVKASPEGVDPAAQTPERRRAKVHKTKGDSLMRASKPALALAHYRQALATDYSYTAAYNEYGTALFRLRRYKPAIVIFRVAIRDNPDYLLGWYNLAYALRKARRLPEAIAAYRKYISLRPTDPDPFFGLGLAYKDAGNKEGAVSAFKSYITHERRDKQARWVHKARVEIAKLEGQPPPTFTPRTSPVLSGIRTKAQLAREVRQLEAAERKATLAAQRAARVEKRRLAREARKLEAAERKSKLAARRAAQAEKRRLAREARKQAAAERKSKLAARRAAQVEKRRLAREARKQAAAERKSKLAARRAARAEKRRLAREARQARKAGRAVDTRVIPAVPPPPPGVQPLADVVEGPSMPPAPGQVPEKVTGKWRVQADTLARRNKCRHAMSMYRRVLSRDPFNTRALDGLAYCAFRVKSYGQGIKMLGMGLRDNPEYVRGWLHLARLERAGGHRGRAVGFYRKYLRKVSDDPTGVFELARTLKSLGLHQQAIVEYRRYLRVERRSNQDARRVAAHQELKALGGERGGAAGSGAKSGEPASTARSARVEKRRLAREARKLAATARKAKAAAARAARVEKRRSAREARKLAATARKAKAAAARAARAEKRRLAKLKRVRGKQGKGATRDPSGTLAAAIEQDLRDTASPAVQPGPAYDLLKPAPEAALGLMAVADKQFARKRYDVAMGIYQQAAQLDPTATEPLYKAGVSAVALGRMHLAADLFAQVMQLDPNNGTAMVNLKMARAAAREILPDATYIAEATSRIRHQIENGRYAAAERKLDQLIADQVSAQLHMLRADARLALGKAEGAIQDGGRSLALNPGLLDAFRIMGYAQQQLNRPQKAIYYLRLYLARSGADPNTKAKREQAKQTLSELGHL